MTFSNQIFSHFSKRQCPSVLASAQCSSKSSQNQQISKMASLPSKCQDLRISWGKKKVARVVIIAARSVCDAWSLCLFKYSMQSPFLSAGLRKVLDSKFWCFQTQIIFLKYKNLPCSRLKALTFCCTFFGVLTAIMREQTISLKWSITCNMKPLMENMFLK